jgi:hypothetical protein
LSPCLTLPDEVCGGIEKSKSICTHINALLALVYTEHNYYQLHLIIGPAGSDNSMTWPKL